ncbi:MAG: hypothetical protein HRT86_17680 [Ilumatobacteraceae bacterium]|nr:hypothetical protein [Ilumatobacteraceae bacterium]
MSLFDLVMNAESCPRTVEQSCFSREGYRADNVISVMQSLDGRLGEVLAITSGYNDPIGTIDTAIDAVIDEAKRQGVGHVVWLSLRTSADVDYQDPQEQSGIDTFRAYNEQLVEAVAASDGDLQVPDWATYSIGATAWFDYDGVHLSPSGVDALTTFLAGSVERVLAGEDVSPASPARSLRRFNKLSSTPGSPCAAVSTACTATTRCLPSPSTNAVPVSSASTRGSGQANLMLVEPTEPTDRTSHRRNEWETRSAVDSGR